MTKALVNACWLCGLDKMQCGAQWVCRKNKQLGCLCQLPAECNEYNSTVSETTEDDI